MTNMRTFPLSAFVCAALCSAALLWLRVIAGPLRSAAAPTVRIVTQIDEGQLVTLKGNTHPAANAANDRGPVSPDLP